MVPKYRWILWNIILLLGCRAASLLVFLPMLSSASYLNLKIIVFRPNIEGIFQPNNAITWAPGQEEKAPEANTEELQGCLWPRQREQW